MEKNKALGISRMQIAQTVSELQNCNDMTERFGLTLTEQQILTVAQKRAEALADTGRVEFGRGILKSLIFAFCDSPYITRDNYFETLLSLINSFYYFKNESEDLIPDEDLITFMKQKFDTVCQGSLEYLEGTTLEELCRNTRYSDPADDSGLF